MNLLVSTPVNRYLGFSAPINPVESFTKANTDYGVNLIFKDPQLFIIEINPLARIDAEQYGINVAGAIIEYAIKLHGKTV